MLSAEQSTREDKQDEIECREDSFDAELGAYHCLLQFLIIVLDSACFVSCMPIPYTSFESRERRTIDCGVDQESYYLKIVYSYKSHGNRK